MMADSSSGVGFERLFNDWDRDTDISMVDLGNDFEDSSRTRRPQSNSSLDEISHRETDDRLSELPPLPRTVTDDASTRWLLRKSSYTTTSDLEGKSPTSPDEPRKRNGLKVGVQQLWHKKSFRSQRTLSSFDGNFAHGRPGWWKKQMLVDRSLRSMAAFTAVCAVVMMIIVLSYGKDFVRRLNKHTTSVGGKDGENCDVAESRNVAVHLFINIAATMILGCSNTYQQLVTSLKVHEIRWVLSSRGDSKVGTNSPWNIAHKKEGRLKAWLCWILLISTSIPVHFLANSVIGPSFYIHTPSNLTYTELEERETSNFLTQDAGCWTAFRTGSYALPKYAVEISPDYNTEILGNSTTWASVNVRYTTNCTQYRGTGTLAEAVQEFDAKTFEIYHDRNYEIGDCFMAYDVTCVFSDQLPKQCRMNVRMQAAFILMSCLFIKAGYMIAQNYLARYKTKEHVLTIGDVIVASVLDSNLKIKNEALLNAGDGYRNEVVHTCHKHCKDVTPCTTGDAIGHCQKCNKYNITNMAADLPHPHIAIKYKRSLLSSLGSTAITQMLILFFSSASLLAVSIVLIVNMVLSNRYYRETCKDVQIGPNYGPRPLCQISESQNLKQSFGTWGGFSSSATLTSFNADNLGSELLAFAIANGPQFLYSLLYLLLIYNLSLISMEHEWGSWETKRKRPRCTIVSGKPFQQSYFLQLPSKLLIPLMAYAALMHWLLGQALSTAETIFTDPVHGIEHSIYFVTYAAYPIFISTVLMVGMTTVCWWAFTYTREGFIPQMYGSIRACCASTSDLTDFNPDGIQWGDLGMGERFRHAGFTSDEPGKIIPAELYS